MHVSSVLLAVSLLAPFYAFAQSTVHSVTVGSARGDLTFLPLNTVAAVGDSVQFVFVGANHSVVTSTFSKPCTPGTDASSFFNSGFMPVGIASNAASLPTFTISINDTDPIYFYCAQAKHCQAGMVGGINTPADTDSIADYKLAAAAVVAQGTSQSSSTSIPVAYSPTSSPVAASPSSRSKSQASQTPSPSSTTPVTPTSTKPTEQSATSSSTDSATPQPTITPGTGISAGLIAGVVLGSVAILLAATGLLLWSRQMPLRRQTNGEFVNLKSGMDTESTLNGKNGGVQELEVRERPVEMAGPYYGRHSIYELGSDK